MLGLWDEVVQADLHLFLDQFRSPGSAGNLDVTAVRKRMGQSQRPLRVAIYDRGLTGHLDAGQREKVQEEGTRKGI